MRYFVVQTISNNLHHDFFFVNFENAKNRFNPQVLTGTTVLA
jgi:hypothetical protein